MRALCARWMPCAERCWKLRSRASPTCMALAKTSRWRTGLRCGRCAGRANVPGPGVRSVRCRRRVTHERGGASMGALRAAELRTLGMTGVGRIFRWYRDGIVIDDAEVALLHADAEHGYRALTVPLVNVRWSAQRCLPPRAAEQLIEASSRLFYQERTEGAVL